MNGTVINTNDIKRCNIMSLAPLPNHIPVDQLRIVEECEMHYEASNTRNEVWAIALIVSEDDPTKLRGVGRVMIREEFGYGG